MPNVRLRRHLCMLAVLSSLGASCRTTADMPPWSACGRFTAPQIAECSGIVRSRQFSGVYWVHNDSGDAARLFAVNARGQVLREVWVTGATNVDWEDIAADDAGQLYLGDFGNNRNERHDLVVYVIDEPDPGSDAAGILQVPVKRRLPFRYRDQHAFPDSMHLNFDCEAMFWDAGRLYLLTKHRTDLGTVLYRLDPECETEQPAVRIGAAEIGSPVTAADLSPDGQTLAVLSYQYLTLFQRPRTGEDFLAGASHRVLLEARQCEAVCFDGDRILVANEQRDLFCLPLVFLRAHDRWLPLMPEVQLPSVEPQLDGNAGEWRRTGGAGTLRWNYVIEPTAAAPRPESGRRAAFEGKRRQGALPGTARRPRSPRDAVVRVGWTPAGVLVHAHWPLPPGGDAWRDWDVDDPVAWFMFGPGSDEPQLGPGQRVWGAVVAGDSLRLRAAGAPEAARARSVTRRGRDRVDFEAWLPAAEPLRAGSQIRLDVVLLEPAAGGRGEWSWSASLDMQPQINPLLWGRGVLRAR